MGEVIFGRIPSTTLLSDSSGCYTMLMRVLTNQNVRKHSHAASETRSI